MLITCDYLLLKIKNYTEQKQPQQKIYIHTH